MTHPLVMMVGVWIPRTPSTLPVRLALSHVRRGGAGWLGRAIDVRRGSWGSIARFGGAPMELLWQFGYAVGLAARCWQT